MKMDDLGSCRVKVIKKNKKLVVDDDSSFETIDLDITSNLPIINEYVPWNLKVDMGKLEPNGGYLNTENLKEKVSW